MISLSNHEDIHNSTSELLAWSLRESNEIKVTELDEKQEEYTNFEGVQLFNTSINRD